MTEVLKMTKQEVRAKAEQVAIKIWRSCSPGWRVKVKERDWVFKDNNRTYFDIEYIFNDNIRKVSECGCWDNVKNEYIPPNEYRGIKLV